MSDQATNLRCAGAMWRQICADGRQWLWRLVPPPFELHVETFGGFGDVLHALLVEAAAERQNRLTLSQDYHS